MPVIKVNVYANLRQYTDGAASTEVEMQPGDTIQQLIGRLGIPREQVHIVLVNRRAVVPEHALEGNERIDLFSAIGGG